VAYNDPFAEALNFLSQTFNLPSSWFVYPHVVFYFVIPIIALTAAYYTIINKRLRIIRNGTIAFVFSLVLAFMSSFLIGIFTPAIVLALAFGITTFFWGYRVGWKNILAALVVVVLIFFLYPQFAAMF